MRSVLQYTQERLKIREERHTRINFLLQVMWYTETLFAEEGTFRKMLLCRGWMLQDRTKYIYIQRPVQTMLWRLVFGYCSCKHFCDLRFLTLHLHFFTLVQMTWMNVKGEIQISNETLLFTHIQIKTDWEWREFVWLSGEHPAFCLRLASRGMPWLA